ncbi:SNF2 family N-terminal domain-domain-containing protein [Absidia repens]|uniref:SNF2 family N-terminal domain-domain-containing protein n=1 Tax=Absidia repens TaxID=90262 RepID=A0A1X2IFB6_9FUNG|nr:SNF2 family N-terminal domain-domain-containing protein [Absidia repens]
MANQREMFNPYMAQQGNYQLNPTQSTSPQQQPQQPNNTMMNMNSPQGPNTTNGYPSQQFPQQQQQFPPQQDSPPMQQQQPSPQRYMGGYMGAPPPSSGSSSSGGGYNMNQGFLPPQGYPQQQQQQQQQRPMYQQPQPSSPQQSQQQMSPQQRMMMYNMMQQQGGMPPPPQGMPNQPSPFSMPRPPPPQGFNMQQIPPPPQFTNGMNVQLHQQRMHQYQQMVRMQQMQYRPPPPHHIQQQQHQQQQKQQQQQQQQHPQFRPLPHPPQHQFQHQFRPFPPGAGYPQQHQQQQFQYHHLQQHPPQPTRRSGRATKKRKPLYEESSDEEDLALSEESSPEANDDDLEEESDDEGTKKRKKNGSDEEESVVIPMGTKEFERMLDYRQNPETGDEELLIKYKNTSFHHVDWVPIEQIEAEHLGKHRVKKFLKKWEEDGEKGEDFRENLKLDRVVDEGELEDPETGELKIFYLCKWNAQFYDHCTWEKEDDVEKIDEHKIEEFTERRIITDVKLKPSPPRPMLAQFMKYDRSPAYRYGNELRSYQLEGLNWLRFCYYGARSCILADEMGLGKTVQSVALLNDIYHILGIKGPFLIVAPLSTIPHWERAFKAWTDLNVIDYRGSNMARNLIVDTEFYYKDHDSNNIPDRYKFDVLITTYEMASSSAPLLSKIHWKCGVFDEAHRLKNKQSKVLEILRTFYIEHKLLLTGTPLQNNLDELYSLLNFMQPDVFSDENYFFSEYGSLQSAAQVEKLQALLKPIMLRRFKEDVEKTIPVKEETVVEVELTNPQKKWYRAILEKNFSFLRKGAKTNKEMPHLRNIMMQLRKCCIHPYLLEGAEEVIVSECNAQTPQDQFSCLVNSSGKLVLIDKLLKKLILGNHKVLIFSQFTSCLDILSDYLRRRKYAFERIDGSVPGDQRQAAIDRFSTLPIEESFVFLLCTRAGGVGINLTAADTCIIFDSDWNPQNDLQAQARCHRIGQTKPVQIYRLICANTYEKDMFDRAGMKLGLDKAVMSRSGPTGEPDNGQPNKHELTKQEIENLLKKGAYGAMLDDEASTQFCEEDIDQILERRTKVIKHEGNEQGSVFSKATFSAGAGDVDGVELDDPDFWEKWAAKANIDTTEIPEEKNKLILLSPRRRRTVQRFGTKNIDSNYSDNEGDNSDAAYEEDEEDEDDQEVDAPEAAITTRRGRKIIGSSPTPSASSSSSSRGGRGGRRGGRGGRGGRGRGAAASTAASAARDRTVRLWTLSEKTKYERKLMVFGYGAWQKMQVDFPRRSEKDLKAVTRALMRHLLPTIDKKTDEDKKLAEDIDQLLQADTKDEVVDDFTVPYKNANKKQTAEFRSFLVDATDDYLDRIGRKGRNLLLRIQMLHNIRDKILPKNWNDAKNMQVPEVTGAQPAKWWGKNEDRDLMLGICKHGYQQYLDIRNDPEFCFSAKKYLDQDEDTNASNDKNDEYDMDDDVDEEDGDTGLEPDVKDQTKEPEVKDDAKESGDSTSMEKEMAEPDHEKEDEETCDQTTFVWPSKADIGMRLRRVIAACMRDQTSEPRKRKAPTERKPPAPRRTRQRKTSAIAPASGRRPTRAAAAKASSSLGEDEQHQQDDNNDDMSPPSDIPTTSVTAGDDDDTKQEVQSTMTGDIKEQQKESQVETEEAAVVSSVNDINSTQVTKDEQPTDNDVQMKDEVDSTPNTAVVANDEQPTDDDDMQVPGEVKATTVDDTSVTSVDIDINAPVVAKDGQPANDFDVPMKDVPLDTSTKEEDIHEQQDESMSDAAVMVKDDDEQHRSEGTKDEQANGIDDKSVETDVTPVVPAEKNDRLDSSPPLVHQTNGHSAHSVSTPEINKEDPPLDS